MVRDAESHEDEDKRRREQVEARNAADSLVYSAEKMLADNADNIRKNSSRRSRQRFRR